MTGYTGSSSGIAFGGFQNGYAGGRDAYLVKFDAAGSRLWATYYGGAGFDIAWSVTTDACGNPYIAGYTYSSSGIASGGFQNALAGTEDCFAARYGPSGNQLCATYYGGNGTLDEYGHLALDGSGNVYMTGYTTSSSGIASGGFQNTISAAFDAFLVKFTSSNSTSSVVGITGNNNICAGNSTTLTASGGGSYTWNTGATIAAITVSPVNTSTYSVVIINNCVSDTLFKTVMVNSLPIAAISGSDSICSGSNIVLTGSGGGNYFWDPTGLTTSSISVSPNITTTYTLTVTDTANCSAIATMTVIVKSLPNVVVSNDITITQGSSVQLTATGGGTYYWTPATGLSCTSCANPIATPIVDTQYCVTVTTNNCSNDKCVNITVDTKCGDVFIPTVFSPNDDGQNDRVCIYSNCFVSMIFAIYDRWGNTVFETSDPNDVCWDGMYHGKAMDGAVFTYRLQATLITNKTIFQKGNITLVK